MKAIPATMRSPRIYIDIIFRVCLASFYENIFRTSAVSSTNFGSMLTSTTSCVVGTGFLYCCVGEFFIGSGPILNIYILSIY